MRVKLIIFLIGVLLIAGCTSQPQGKKVIYTVEEPQEKTFVVEQKNPLSWMEETKDERLQQNVRRFLDEDEDDLEEFELESKLNNVRRIIDGKLIIGYDQELDNPDFKEVD